MPPELNGERVITVCAKDALNDDVLACQTLVNSDYYLEGTELEFVIMVIAVSCVKLLSAHNSTQHTSRKHKV
jgi:hypothetical protein